MADWYWSLEMYPFFDLANCLHKAIAIREDSGSNTFSREHPFASWIATMVACFAQKMLANALLARPIVDPWADSALVVMATMTWYLINYSPFDIVYNVTQKIPCPLIIAVMVEVYRENQIYEGTMNASGLILDYSPLYVLTIGTIYGNGLRFLLLIHRLIRGVWTPEEIEFMTPSCETRMSFVASLIFYMVYDVTPTIYLCVFFFLLTMKAMTLWVPNPFSYVETLLYNGTIGVWDRISSKAMPKEVAAVAPAPAPAPTSAPKAAGKGKAGK